MKPGDILGVSPQALADELKGHVWGCPDENGVMYDAEFTGNVIDKYGSLEVKIKRKSEKQPS